MFALEPGEIPSFSTLPLPTKLTSTPRTDKKQHFSEKVTKVESILATDNKPTKEEVVAEPAAAVERKESESGLAPAQTQQRPLTPATNQGTWASMFKK
jgi:hypothetical protein